ncbi:hypothetical protein [Carnobacterium sp. TMP28]|uniref:hypothetical protein n=1 Tax=Carnobacterium sp. TMP28 TaxID=3397060 RepID=UPI0039E1EE17
MTETLWGVVIGGLITFLSTIIGGVITFITNYFNNKKEELRLEKSLQHEKINLKREDKLERLYNILIPVIELYEKNEIEKDTFFIDFQILGNGLRSIYINDLEKIIERNKRYMSVDLIKSFNRVKSTYNFEMEHNGLGAHINFLEEEDERLVDCMFDNDKNFIKRIEQEAEDIENEYTK